MAKIKNANTDKIAPMLLTATETAARQSPKLAMNRIEDLFDGRTWQPLGAPEDVYIDNRSAFISNAVEELVSALSS
ncbi:hypothetical protein GA0061102_100325 [Rhizobium miluonense]|uniref:Uncharacterized protein n=2 Tax=Rhizobium miluonense TaxID=411945 RepID=A0A1C3UDA8_9HYPH|nr:hypothetical protein GA0061102_100325 [Rhizobium miluonense]